jgi:hypothetical protein
MCCSQWRISFGHPFGTQREVAFARHCGRLNVKPPPEIPGILPPGVLSRYVSGRRHVSRNGRSRRRQHAAIEEGGNKARDSAVSTPIARHRSAIPESLPNSEKCLPFTLLAFSDTTEEGRFRAGPWAGSRRGGRRKEVGERGDNHSAPSSRDQQTQAFV